ncbi:ABC1 kinase family protein [Piscinibacter gummiphilus]|uniref:AarF/UbiB family protein n=1 Tax=Piscinibacter gummiphilus TaxID=946333 RepID=A0ABZ0D020_9BURK|nr:AarF/UbiB family protein [Piscinibacter gummiphilus]WOB10597.1 AarF/UbiB family protein [Piscinibacter gummiphilus]
MNDRAMSGSTLSRPRELARLQEIVAVLVRHGLGDAVRRMGWADLLEKAGQLVHWTSAAELARLSPPLQVRRALEELGPTFVKLGQILAGRADLFGPEWIAEFEKLHSRVPAVPFEALHDQLVEDLGGEPGEVFASFDPTPLAAASIAQVHRARLHDGAEVVVKVRRPGIRPVIEADLRLLERLASIAASRWPDLQPYRPVALVQEFGRSLRRELDLANECRQAERIAANFAERPEIVIPKVYWEWTHERVNVQQLIDGLPGDALERADGEGLDRKLLAKRGAQAVMKMVVEDGLFHADPHPGNVFYLSGNRIAFIDFGMVGRLSAQRRDELLKLMLGLVQRDAAAVSDVLLEWADGSAEEEAQLNGDIEAFVDAYHGVPLARLSLADMLADVTGILRRHRLGLPSDLALLIKAFVTVEGMGRGLDPDFHMAAEALPLLRRALRARYRPQAIVRRSWQSINRLAGLLAAMPDDLARLLRNVRHGGVQVHIEVKHLERVGDQLDRAASRLTVGLVVAALIVGSSIVMTVQGGPKLFGLPAFGLIGFVGACVGAVWLLRSISRSGRHDGK